MIPFKNAWLMRSQGSQPNSKHAQNISIHTVTLYFTSSFNDSFIYTRQRGNSYARNTVINKGATCYLYMILIIMPFNAWEADFW